MLQAAAWPASPRRAGLGEEVYRAENAALRDTARRLADLRDAQALVGTFDQLGERFKDEIDRRRIAPVRRALVTRRRRLAAGGDALERRVGDFRAELEATRARLPSWPLAEADFDLLAPGLERTYRRARKAMRAAYDARSGARFHEWRKPAKCHHLDLLCELWPRPLNARRKEVGALGAMLGDEHDLAVLRATLAAEATSFGGDARTAIL